MFHTTCCTTMLYMHKMFFWEHNLKNNKYAFNDYIIIWDVNMCYLTPNATSHIDEFRLQLYPRYVRKWRKVFEYSWLVCNTVDEVGKGENSVRFWKYVRLKRTFYIPHYVSYAKYGPQVRYIRTARTSQNSLFRVGRNDEKIL